MQWLVQTGWCMPDCISVYCISLSDINTAEYCPDFSANQQLGFKLSFASSDADYSICAGLSLSFHLLLS